VRGILHHFALQCLQELDELQCISQKVQLAANRTAQAARSIRYPVKLSRYSYELLMTYLQSNNLSMPLSLINEHISVQVRPPQTRCK
jgi:transcription initiation factor TFIID subunit 5